MRFTKMHGIGNDYIYVYGEAPGNIAALSARLSDRHKGIGADGMVYISPSACADFKMRIFNADGSEAMMCGNGIRCVGKYVYDKGYTGLEHITVETLSGVKTLSLQVAGGKVRAVTVDMGAARLEEERQIQVAGEEWVCTPVSMGNPHAVFFTQDAAQVPLAAIGPEIEHHQAFPGGVNAEFVQVLGKNSLRMRVWERGSGITMACGTGACASVAAAVRKGFCPYGEPVAVQLDGGTLEIQIDKNNAVTMTGPAETVYEGEIDI